jgi:hypothetical protein
MPGGRVVVPFNTGPSLNDTSTGTLISDDGGASWSASTNLVQGGNEGTVALTTDRRLVLDMRPSDDIPNSARLVSYSSDAGESWSTPFRRQRQLIRCQGSMIAMPSTGGVHDEDGTFLLFSHPATTRRIRGDLTLWRSDDSGYSWRPIELVQEGPSAYSSMQPAASPGSIHIAYEIGISSAIRFATLSIPQQRGDEAAPMPPVPAPAKP